jgi:hypothetical protein
MLMHINSNRRPAPLAEVKFTPVAQVLERLARDIKMEQGGSAVLEQRSPIKQLAQNAYKIRYSLRHPDKVRFSLTFTVVGDNADLLLLEAQERSASQDVRGNPGQVDQQVYSLERIDEIKEAVEQKLRAHLADLWSEDRRPKPC